MIEFRWNDASLREKQLSRRVAQFLADQTHTKQEISAIIKATALLLSSNELAAVPTEARDVVKVLAKRFPEILEVETSLPFASHDEQLSTNLFGLIALEVGMIYENSSLHGIVTTPSVLALDMVRLAVSTWLAPRINLSIKACFEYVSQEKIVPDELRERMLAHLGKAVWYDPCVGTGVFPILAVLVLNQLSSSASFDWWRHIDGFDRDEIMVSAACVRTAFLVSDLTGASFAEVLSGISNLLLVDDSLKYFASQTGLRGCVDRIVPRRKDIVLGNPPYVRSECIPRRTQEFLKQAYPEISAGKVDLYNYFIVHSLNALTCNGVLCFVSPASFQKSRYGKAIRKFISARGVVSSVFDFDELPLFNSVSVHPSVYTIVKKGTPTKAMTYSYRQLPDARPIAHGLAHASETAASAFSGEGWFLSEVNVRPILIHLQNKGIPLIDYVGAILSGIKTGCKEAYFISGEELRAWGVGLKVKNLFRPLLLPKDIRAYCPEWSGTYILIVKKGEVIPKNSYLMKHFEKFEARLKARTDIQGHPTWYGLRECRYYSVFEKPKVIFPDIASECRFAIDRSGYYVPDGAFVIPTDDMFLLGVLNSCVGDFYFRAKCSSIGNPSNKGRLRFKKTYVSSFPVPVLSGKNAGIKEQIEHGVETLCASGPSTKLLQDIDRLVLRAYGISPKLWRFFRR